MGEKVRELEAFQQEYSAIPDAKAEASRIVRDAKDYAFVMVNRTDREYAEIMQHANEEAEAIRAMAQERLKHSHEALKKALSRASDIIEEAHAEAAKISREAYLTAPATNLLDAPQDEAQASEEFEEEAPKAPEQGPSGAQE